jgi:biopolymer transport protein ExbD
MAIIGVALGAAESCRVSISGRSFSFPADEQGLLAALRREAMIHSEATIEADTSVPYRCFGGAIVLAQRAGFKRVGFIAEPPPPTKE